MSEEIVTATQAAAIIGVSRMTVSRWARQGKLPIQHTLPGLTGAVLFRKDEIEAIAAARKETTKA